MNERTENRIEGWDSKPLTGGFAELRELADGGFSGVARARGTTLFMLNGRVVGVFGGSIDDFADAEATAYQAPHPSLPLLFAMKEYGGEQQAKYYTNDTPISEAHEQLSDAQFTGYIELSENVLSGDYYVVYYGGRSMSCAFVGNSQRLEAGDEAFQLADDEVGIYEVVAVDIEVTDIPEANSAAGGGDQPAEAQGTDGGTDTTPAGGGGPGAEAPQEPDPGATTADPDAQAGAGAQGDRETGAGADAGTDRSAGQGAAESEPGGADRPGDTGSTGAQSSSGGGATEPADRDGAGRGDDRDENAEADGRPEAVTDADTANTTDAGATDPGTRTDPQTEAAADRAVEAASGPQGTGTTGAATTTGGVPKSEAAFGELRPVPSLSPKQTAVAEPGEERGAESGEEAPGRDSATESGGAGRTADTTGRSSGAGSGTDGRSAAGRSGATDATRSGSADTSRAGSGDTNRAASAETSGTDVTQRATREVDVEVETGDAPEPVPDDAGAPELRQQLRAREGRIEELEAALTDLRVQRDGLTDERDRLESEVQRLESEVTDLESEVERLQSRLKDGTEGKQRLSADDALEATNLFIRYDSKSGGTLDKAHRGEVAKEEVNNNLRLEHHTQFDADEVVVDGEPFGDFLRGTIYRGFVEWVVRDLLYEIQDTGHVKALSDLYDAIPRIDRAELLGDVSVKYVEDGEEYREQRSFDVVLRDRMGNPLIVANLNDSRNPADREMMETVIQNGIDVKESNESLSSSMMVTASFFKPGALEAADESAGGGLLSRESKKSYVKVNRKKGYHLVLVESREGDFHVNVPEL